MLSLSVIYLALDLHIQITRACILNKSCPELFDLTVHFLREECLHEEHVFVSICRMEISFLTFSTDAPEVCDLHQHFGEHMWFMRPPLSHVDL